MVLTMNVVATCAPSLCPMLASTQGTRRLTRTSWTHIVTSAESAFETRRRRAMVLLEKSGIRKSNYLPPATALLWRLGVEVPPPHFASFASTASVAGLYFGVIWGTIMWLAVWSSQAASFASALFSAVFAGVLFGVSMAAYYAYGRKKHQFPAWDSLVNEGDAA